VAETDIRPDPAQASKAGIDVIAAGSGDPVVLIPGIQGRWEWQRPAFEALARRCRVVTYSLSGERGSACRLTPDRGFDAHIDQLDRVLDGAGLERAALCGVSYGGWIALRYAACRPARVTALVLVSSPGPHFRPNARQMRYVRAPWALFPLFMTTARTRMRAEVLAALPEARDRWLVVRHQLATMAKAPISPGLMARRMRLALKEDFAADCAAVRSPTLVVTGERRLDRIVPVETTIEYCRLIRGATAVELPHTGHIGLITRPDPWATLVCRFVHEAVAAEESAQTARA
jgi:pimeloyl-ACP methyl ester carboxylesterase